MCVMTLSTVSRLSVKLGLYSILKVFAEICPAQESKHWCTINNVIRTTIVVYLTAAVIQLTRFIEMSYR
jgi:hypothetical protein